MLGAAPVAGTADRELTAGPIPMGVRASPELRQVAASNRSGEVAVPAPTASVVVAEAIKHPRLRASVAEAVTPSLGAVAEGAAIRLPKRLTSAAMGAATRSLAVEAEVTLAGAVAATPEAVDTLAAAEGIPAVAIQAAATRVAANTTNPIGEIQVRSGGVNFSFDLA